LKARYVIHAVGPVYWRQGQERAAELLASAYRRSLEVAAEHDVQRVAFPAISTGAYGYPMDEAASVALQAVIEYLETEEDHGIRLVRFVLYSAQAHQVFQRVLSRLIEQTADTGGG
jgi:O-acetyl-ADP-ribose deacetylase (regulator of RNase III)